MFSSTQPIRSFRLGRTEKESVLIGISEASAAVSDQSGGGFEHQRSAHFRMTPKLRYSNTPFRLALRGRQAGPAFS